MAKARWKRRSRRFLLCFGGKGTTLEVEVEEASIAPSLSSSSSDSYGRDHIAAASRKNDPRRRNAARRLLAKIVRHSVFPKSLEKGSGEKSPDDGDGSASPSSYASSVTDTCTGTTLSTTPTTSCASSVMAHPSPRPMGNPMKPRWRESAVRVGFPTGLVLILVLCLVVMLLWGRLCAILWTSTCLCLASRGAQACSQGYDWKAERGTCPRRRPPSA